MGDTLLEQLHLPVVPRIVFQRSPLVLTVCQVRFQAMPAIADPEFIASFQRAIQADYPVAVPSQQVELQLIVGSTQAEIQQGRRLVQWQFTDDDDNWKVVLTQDFVAIDTRKYEGFDEFLTRLRRVLRALIQHIRPAIGTRIGLRYVNEIRLDTLACSDTIRPELLGPLATTELEPNTESVVQDIALRFPEDEGLNIRHGRFPQGTTIQPYPQDESKNNPFYLLDLDVFREFPTAPGLPMDVETLCQTLALYNKTLYRVFRWSTTDKYIATLGVREHDAG